MQFKIMGAKGDTVLDYDVETGAIKFEELVNANMLPVEVTSEGNKLMKSFDSTVEKVIWLPKLKGG